ncbi:hypothetical protein J6590_011372 [Homalodisca vitripennis]|nr:hypothetical protein J6590_011372 [Homalodisca vitripennis]
MGDGKCECGADGRCKWARPGAVTTVAVDARRRLPLPTHHIETSETPPRPKSIAGLTTQVAETARSSPPRAVLR